MDIPPYCSLKLYTWVCVLFWSWWLLLSLVGHRNHLLPPLLNFFSSLNSPAYASRFLKYPLSDSSFFLPKWHGLNPFKLLPTTRTVLDGLSPIYDPYQSIDAYFPFLCLFLSSSSFFLAVSFVIFLLPPPFLLSFFVFRIFVPVDIFFSFSYFSVSVSFIFVGGFGTS